MPTTHILTSPNVLWTNEHMRSVNNWFFAVMQSDGNFCVYRGTPERNRGWFWGSQVAPGEGRYFAAMQTDGNFCVYSQADPSQAIWCSQAVPGEGNYFAAMQDDGNFCVYSQADSSQAIWCSGVHTPVGAEHARGIRVHNLGEGLMSFNIEFTDGTSSPGLGDFGNGESATIRYEPAAGARGAGTRKARPSTSTAFLTDDVAPGMDMYPKATMSSKSITGDTIVHRAEHNVLFDPQSPDIAVYDLTGPFEAPRFSYQGLSSDLDG